jgi:hypothetical protein
MACLLGGMAFLGRKKLQTLLIVAFFTPFWKAKGALFQPAGRVLFQRMKTLRPDETNSLASQEKYLDTSRRMK